MIKLSPVHFPQILSILIHPKIPLLLKRHLPHIRKHPKRIYSSKLPLHISRICLLHTSKLPLHISRISLLHTSKLPLHISRICLLHTSKLTLHISRRSLLHTSKLPLLSQIQLPSLLTTSLRTLPLSSNRLSSRCRKTPRKT